MAEAILRSTLGARTTVMAALSYLSVLCFVPLLVDRDDEFVYFHAKQGLVIWMWGVLALFALHVPVLGKWIFGFSSMGWFPWCSRGRGNCPWSAGWPTGSEVRARMPIRTPGFAGRSLFFDHDRSGQGRMNPERGFRIDSGNSAGPGPRVFLMACQKGRRS